MRDIKTKPKMAKPKVLDKMSLLPKNKKDFVMEKLLKQRIPEIDNSRENTNKSDNATNYAIDKVESGTRQTADYARHKTENFIRNRFRRKNTKTETSEKPLGNQQNSSVGRDYELTTAEPTTTEPPQTEPKKFEHTPANQKTQKQPDMQERMKSQAHRKAVENKIKQKEQYSVSSDFERPQQDGRIKTKEYYHYIEHQKNVDNDNTTPEHTTKRPTDVKIHSEQSQTNAPKQPDMRERMQTQAQKKAAENKVKQKEHSATSANSEQPKPHDGRIKTRDYVEQQKAVHTDNAVQKHTLKKPVDRKIYTEQAQAAQKNLVRKEVSSIKKKQAADTATKIKTKANSTAAKPTNATKTAKVIKKRNPAKIATKQAAKQARRKAQKKIAQETAKRTAQAAKATAKATAKLTVKVAQMVVAATKALVSALIAMGGWAVLIVVLIVVIIVAAIAASPFGIFISDEAHDVGSIPLSVIVAECNVEFTQKLDDIENSVTHDRTELEGQQANWNEILAVFAVKTAGTDDNTAQDVVVIDETKKGLLKAVFWDMNAISHRTQTVSTGENASEMVLYITITGKTSNDMVSQYHFTTKQQEALATLLDNSDILISATQSLAISDATAADIVRNLSATLSTERKNIIKAACSLVGKVNYFWGGKSAANGWDSNWGKMMKVSAAGSTSTGTIRPFGLDCSGFVTWAFINAGLNTNSIGHGTNTQNGNCTRIDWNNAQAGDLAFYNDLSHVGIIVGKDTSGNILVVHCNSSRNNVSITTNSGFGFAARPNVLH